MKRKKKTANVRNATTSGCPRPRIKILSGIWESKVGTSLMQHWLLGTSSKVASSKVSTPF
jgi:hypothetical protein